MSVTDEGIETLKSAEHPFKAELPMCITEKELKHLKAISFYRKLNLE